VADDGADPARALSIARDMVETRGVIAFVGNIEPLSVSGIKGYLEERKVPVVGVDGAIDTWWQSPVFFPALGYIVTGIIGGADVAVKAGKPHIGVIYCGEATACTNAYKYLAEGGAESVGARIVYSAQVSLAQPDFTSECLQARDAKVEAVVAPLDGSSLSRLARSCAQQNFHPQFVSYGLALIDTIQKDANLEGLIGVTTGFPWFSDDPALGEFRDAMRRYAPRVPLSGASATVWGGGKLLEAGARTLSANPTPQEIIDGVGSLKNETLGGLVAPLNFTRGGLPTRSPCFVPIKLTGGRFTAPDGIRSTCIAPR
jgi:branched-chain amino acid transport system substrate-binding protein